MIGISIKSRRKLTHKGIPALSGILFSPGSSQKKELPPSIELFISVLKKN